MLIIEIVGMMLVAMAAVIGIYCLYKPEVERGGPIIRVRPGGDIQKAIDRVGEPYFWTDRRLAVLATILTVVGLAMSIFAVISTH